MDRIWSALVRNRAQSALLIPMGQNEMTYEKKIMFEDLGCSKLTVAMYSLRHGVVMEFMKKFRGLEEIQQRDR